MVRNEGGVVSGVLNLESSALFVAAVFDEYQMEQRAEGISLLKRLRQIPLPTYGGGWN